MGRCGVRTQEETLPLAERIAALPGLTLRGVQAYEGHCMLEPDPDKRVADAHAANQAAIDAFDLLAEHGHPVQVISAGGTGTYFITGANPRIHEVQAGSYALMDSMHGALVPGGFEVAMTVAGAVLSRHGNTVVLDCGRKSVGIDFVTPPLVSHPGGEVRFFAEEHCLVDFPGNAPARPRRRGRGHGRLRTDDREPARRLPRGRGRRRHRHLAGDAARTGATLTCTDRMTYCPARVYPED